MIYLNASRTTMRSILAKFSRISIPLFRSIISHFEFMMLSSLIKETMFEFEKKKVNIEKQLPLSF